MAKELNAKFTADTGSAEKKLAHIISTLEKMDETAKKMGGNFDISSAVVKMESEVGKISLAWKKTGAEVDKVTNKLKKQGSVMSFLKGKASKLAAAYLGIQGLKAAINATDTFTGAENRLNYLNAQQLGDQGVTTTPTGAETYSKVTLDTTSEQMDKMYKSAQKVRIAYTDMIANVSKSMTLAGKAFGQNTDNAIRFQEIMAEAYKIGGQSAAEQASSMYQMIQALGSGRLQGDELRSVTEGAPLAAKAIEAYAQKVYNTTESLKDMASQGKITSDIVVKAMLEAGDEMDSAFAKSTMTFAELGTKLQNSLLKAFQPLAAELTKMVNGPYIKKIIAIIDFVLRSIGLILAMIVRLFTFLQTTLSNMLDFLGSFFGITTENVKWVIQTTLLGLAATVEGLKSLGQTLLGVFRFAAAWLKTAWYNVNSFIANVANGFVVMGRNIKGNLVAAFKNITASVKNLFADAINWIMDKFGSIIDIFNGIRSALGQDLLPKSSTRIQHVSESASYAMEQYTQKYNYQELPSLSDYLPTNETSLTERAQVMADKWYEKLSKAFTQGQNLETSAVDSAGVLADDSDGKGGNKSTDKIAKDTAAILDSLKMSEKDLEALTDLAELEWKKEFTTASININMTNNNNIKDGNVDGFVTKITDMLYDELAAVAAGAYV